MKQFIYADNAATTRLSSNAFEAMKPYLLEAYGNASQPYSFARTVKKALKESREIIAECIGASSDEIFFTSGGTESNNWAIKGSAFADEKKRTTITSQIEHHTVLHSCADIERLGYPVAYLPVNTLGQVSDQALTQWMTSDTRLVSIMLANNEIGTIQPIKALCDIAHRQGAIFHTDAVQAVGHINVDVKELGVDMLSASAHKFNGPKGIGFLYVKKGTLLRAHSSGGAQEQNMRAGTENIASIVAMAIALTQNCKNMSSHIQHILKLESALTDMLHTADLKFYRNGAEPHIPGNMSLSFQNCSGEVLLHRLDLMGICVSTGSACNSQNTQLSHVLDAIGLEPAYALGTIRISFGIHNTIEDAIAIGNALLNIINL